MYKDENGIEQYTSKELAQREIDCGDKSSLVDLEEQIRHGRLVFWTVPFNIIDKEYNND
jgi:hypothetical protein